MGQVYQATDTTLNQSGKVMRWCVSAIGSARRSVSSALRVIALVMTTQLAWGGTVGSQVPSLSSPATESTVSDSWEAVFAIPLGTRLLVKLVGYSIEGDLVDVQQNVISVATDRAGTVRLDRLDRVAMINSGVESDVPCEVGVSSAKGTSKYRLHFQHAISQPSEGLGRMPLALSVQAAQDGTILSETVSRQLEQVRRLLGDEDTNPERAIR